MFKRFINWIKVVSIKTAYVVSHPHVLWKEYREEVRARMWARNVAKNK
jgi:hypothetical protein